MLISLPTVRTSRTPGSLWPPCLPGRIHTPAVAVISGLPTLPRITAHTGSTMQLPLSAARIPPLVWQRALPAPRAPSSIQVRRSILPVRVQDRTPLTRLLSLTPPAMHGWHLARGRMESRLSRSANPWEFRQAGPARRSLTTLPAQVSKARIFILTTAITICSLLSTHAAMELAAPIGSSSDDARRVPDTDGNIFVYHYYDGNNNGNPALGMNLLGWTTDGWPYVQ